MTDVRLIQTTPAPLFRGTVPTDLKLNCNNCGAVLIDNYCPENYIAIRIQCFGCERVTETPMLQDGEVLPTPIATLGREGHFKLLGPIDVPRGVTLTIDAEIEREASLTHPRLIPSLSTPIDESLLAAIEAIYDRLTGGMMSRQQKSVLNSIAHGNNLAPENHPLVWSIVHLRRCLAARLVDVSDPADAYAVAAILAFRHCVATWGHHPRFEAIARSFASPISFNHNVALFIGAAMFIQAGNRVGLALTRPSQRTPDLYVRSMGHIIWIEVKAPRELHWPRGITTDALIEASVIATLKRLRGQLDRENQGILLVSSWIADSRFTDQLDSAISAVLSKGAASSGVMGVARLVPSIVAQMPRTAQPFNVTVNYSINYISNPRYAGQHRAMDPLAAVAERRRVDAARAEQRTAQEP